MKLFEFNKKIESQFDEFGGAKITISSHSKNMHLEIEYTQDQSGPFDGPKPVAIFVVIIDLESRYGLRESNFDNVPEKIRTAVFDTVVEFIATPLDRRF